MPTSRRLGYLLIASLALNLFLGGLYAGQWLEGWHRGPGHGHAAAMRFRLGPFVERLPEASRAQARQVMERHRPALRAAYEQIRATRREVRAALDAEPFVPARLQAALAKLREQSGAARAEAHKAMVELAQELPPEARRAMAEGMAHRRPGRPGPPRDR